MAEKFITPVFRGSYVYLNEPHTPPAGKDEDPKPYYGITIVLPKDESEAMAFVKKMNSAIKELITDKYGDPKAKKYKWKNPMKDGDDEVTDQWENSWILQAKTDRQPGVVDRQKQEVIDPTALYSGAWYRASISFYAWDHPTGGKGVSVSLSNVMKIRDDEAFDGRTDAESDFADVEYEDDIEDDDEDLV